MIAIALETRQMLPFNFSRATDQRRAIYYKRDADGSHTIFLRSVRAFVFNLHTCTRVVLADNVRILSCPVEVRQVNK